MAQKGCHFQPEWLDSKMYPEWQFWLRRAKSDVCSALCLACNRTFSLSNMGVQSVKSHSVGKKHKAGLQALLRSPSIGSFLVKAETACATHDTSVCSDLSEASIERTDNNASSGVGTSSSVISTPPSSSSTKTPETEYISNSRRASILDYASTREILESEILWNLTTVSANMSTRAAEHCQKQFHRMFKDSNIATKMSIGKDKQAYLTTFGLGNYFSEKLQDIVQRAEYISVSYDESLNKVIQKTQMDIHVRFWDTDKQRVVTRFLTSQFLDSAKAIDLLRNLYKGLGQVKKENVVSVSMDGPNVNWSMLNLLKSDLQVSAESPMLVEFGSCSLHVIHGALKTGHRTAKWGIIEYLRSTYYLFKDFPSRKGQYHLITGSQLFPSKFCCIRWVENEHAAGVAIKILPNIRKYILEVEKIPNSKVFTKVKTFLEDPFLEAKLGFFHGLAHQLEGFLTKFQRDEPMVPLLYDDLFALLKALMKRLLKKSVLDDLNLKPATAWMKLETIKPVNIVNAHDFELYNVAKAGLRNTLRKPSKAAVLTFKEECLSFLKATVLKIIERSPLKYSVTRALSCLSPSVMLHQTSALKRIDESIDIFMKLNRITGTDGDTIKESYENLISNPCVKAKLDEYALNGTRLDNVFESLFLSVGRGTVSETFKKFVRMVLTLFHGNANVERGFSVNNNCLFDNLQEKSLIAKRVVSEEVHLAGGPHLVAMTPELLLSCRNAEVEAKKKKIMEQAEREVSALIEEIEELQKY